MRARERLAEIKALAAEHGDKVASGLTGSDALWLIGEVERLRAALRRTADAPCSHCGAVDMHGEINTAHFLADQALWLNP